MKLFAYFLIVLFTGAKVHAKIETGYYYSITNISKGRQFCDMDILALPDGESIKILVSQTGLGCPNNTNIFKCSSVETCELFNNETLITENNNLIIFKDSNARRYINKLNVKKIEFWDTPSVNLDYTADVGWHYSTLFEMLNQACAAKGYNYCQYDLNNNIGLKCSSIEYGNCLRGYTTIEVVSRGLQF